MKKNILICMAVIVFSLVGCVSNNHANKRNTEESEINQNKVLLEDDLTVQFDIVANEVSFNEGKVIIRYPSITGIENDDDEKKLTK